MHGLLNIHKPTGMTSRRVVDIVARLAQTKRAGHAGTLDPLASGVLVVCIGWATRLVSFIQDRPKTYGARILLGQRSDTDDITGTITEVEEAPHPTREAVELALQSLTGTIMQVPPRYSAVHVAGRRAHKLARHGKTFSLDARPVDIHRLVLTGYSYPEADVEIDCGSGTYIRSIARDLGDALGCGGVMSALVRCAIGDFTVAEAISIEELRSRPIEELLVPPLAAVAHLPRWPCSPADREELVRGRPLAVLSELPPQDDAMVALVDDAGQLLALGEYDSTEQLLRPRQVYFGAKSGLESNG
jgi:tRNA pseudouridine55 synthase